MPLIKDHTTDDNKTTYADDMHDIMTAVPSWLLRWGITLFFVVLIMVVSIAAIIKYPDVVKTSLKIVSSDVAKPVVPKVTGKLVKLLVNNNDKVRGGQPLGFIESTADHQKVLVLIERLNRLKTNMALNQTDQSFFNNSFYGELGELQPAYQAFTTAYISYKSSTQNGFLVQKRAYLQKDIVSLNQQAVQLKAEKDLQQRDFNLAQDEYDMHKKLAKQNVETAAELRQQESKYLAKKQPLLQTDAAMISANTNYLAKQKEILELDNTVVEEKAKFLQSLNSLLSQAEDWKSKYVLSASKDGFVVFAGTVQENQIVSPNNNVFYINAGNTDYFGEMSIPQNNSGKVRTGQTVLIKLKSFPFEEYGMIKGKLSYLSDVPYHDSVFLSKVTFKLSKSPDPQKQIHLKEGMNADAEIITEDATILQRITRNLIKALKN
ncbi:HlyD family secretion protein [Mucilaginibacter phyllosphaerae]